MSSERSFFQAMSEFGFFSHIYEKLPPEFTAVFEIARVLEDENSELAIQLRDILRLPVPAGASRQSDAEDFHRYVAAGDEYEADLMASHHDISRIYPWQYMLPSRLFDRRLAERTLWMPVSKAPRILPVEDRNDDYTYDARKQKVYILFDTSSSMASHHRIHLAKAVVYYFLKRNAAELGFISLRTFDDHVGDVHTAIDHESFEALMRYVLRLSHLGDGTMLQKALMMALDDIQNTEHLSGAEILVITDGAVALDEQAIRAKLDENVRIHAVKIGHVQVFASDTLIEEKLTSSLKDRDKMLADLMRQEEEYAHALRHTEAHDKKAQLELSLQSIRKRIATRKGELGNVLRENYGNELRNLASVYINLDDLNDTSLFRADEQTIGDLEALAESLGEEADQFLTPDIAKKLAVLHDHVQFLLNYETDDSLRERLRKMDQHLRSLLADAMGEPQPQDAKGEAHSHAQAMPMTDEDKSDLRFLLEPGANGTVSAWKLIFRWLWRAAIKAVTRRTN